MAASPVTVMVGVDGSPGSAQATEWAAAEAYRRGCALALVHVSQPVWVSLGPEDVSLPSTISSTRPAFLDDAVAAVSTEWPGLEVSALELTGRPAQALVAVSDDAALMVLGSHGRSLVARLLVGSVSRHVATQAHCPSVVVRGDSAATMTSRVVVGIDESRTSRVALRMACTEASLRGVPLLVVHAWHDVAQGGYGVWVAPPEVTEQLRVDAERITAEAVAEVEEAFPDVDITMRVLQGHPVTAVLDASHDAQLLVVGAHGHGAFPGMLFGSVATAAIHEAACPVMVIPAVRPS